MLRQILQSYLDNVYPGTTIDTGHAMFGPVHIRFDLGGDLRNGSQQRVRQATERALTLFNETFNNPSDSIWLLIYEDVQPNPSNQYLYQLFSPEQSAAFYDESEEGNINLESEAQKVIIGKLPIIDIPAARILNGIADYEMGFEPCIGQRIIFLNPASDRAFLMYDDRGCYVWSDKARKIEGLYRKYNHWIVDYHRHEIDQYFG